MKTFIIAEAGVNHNGSMNLARQLIIAAKEIGADAIKFQTFKADKVVVQTAEKADYQKKSTEASESQYEMLKRLELSYEQHIELLAIAKENEIEFISSPFDFEAATMLFNMGLKILKLPSGELTNIPFLAELAKLPIELIISTGMVTLSEVEAAIDILSDGNLKSLTILHCVTDYPAPYNEINLRAMLTMKTAFQ